MKLLEEGKMDQTLKPCPVCGSPAELKQVHYFETEQPYSYVHCTNRDCNLHQNAAHFSGGTEDKNSENAIAAWNQRLETQT
jgi:formate dehydrogenase maturation protein FdhE